MIKIATIVEIHGTKLLQKKVSVNPTEKIILNGRIMKAVTPRIRTRYECLLLPILITTVLAIAIRQGKKNIRKRLEEKNKTVIFPDSIISI